MATLTTPTPIELDEPRSLLFDNSAVFNIERELARQWAGTGQQATLLTVVGSMDSGKLSMIDLYVLLWGGLLHESPGLTLDDVSGMIPMSEALTDRTLDPLKDALQAIFPEDDIIPDAPQGDGQAADPLPGSTGENGLPSPASNVASVSVISGR